MIEPASAPDLRLQMRDKASTDSPSPAHLTADGLAAYLRTYAVAARDLPDLVQLAYATLTAPALQRAFETTPPESDQPSDAA